MSVFDGHIANLLHRFPNLWIGAGRFETMLLADRLDCVNNASPIFIAGLARSGSTILLEMLNAHSATASHLYLDFPFVLTPYFWGKTSGLFANKNKLRERWHADGIMVGPHSPEALEELVWMAFFSQLHTGLSSDILDENTLNAEFETFYVNHIKKIMLLRNGTRYLSKANYNISRMRYILRLFPTARFLIPIRNPVDHIGSLIRQHKKLIRAGRKSARFANEMGAAGHFEFGLNRRPIDFGDKSAVQRIEAAWERGDEALGWGEYWALVHDYIGKELDSDERLRAAALVVRFEDLCEKPHLIIRGILSHCLLDGGPFADEWAARMRFPDYYKSPLTQDDVDVITSVTSTAAARFGYTQSNWSPTIV